MNEVHLSSLRPVRLIVEDLGPFGSAPRTTLNFLVPDTTSIAGSESRGRSTGDPADMYPCDLFIIHGSNGSGKTKLLEAIHGLIDLLSCRPVGLFAGYDLPPVPDLSGRVRRLPKAQLDLFAICSIDGVARPIVLTLWFGARDPTDPWKGPDALRRAVAGREWIRIGFDVGSTDPTAATNAAGRRLLEAVRRTEHMPLFVMPKIGDTPIRRDLPTLINAYRSRTARLNEAASAWLTGDPLYAPVLELDLGGGAISGIADDLARMSRSNPEWFDRISRRLALHAFLDEAPPAILTLVPSGRVLISKDGHASHSLRALGSGETALVTLHVAIEMRTTRSSLVLLDDLTSAISRDKTDTLIRSLFSLVGPRSGCMLVMTTSDLDFLKRVYELVPDSPIRCDCRLL